MNPILCQICQKTSYSPDGEIIIMATFSQQYFAKNVLEDLEKAHITPVWSSIFSKDIQTLYIALHGIKDIVQLESLYIESMCRNNNSLTFDTFSTKLQCQKLLQQLQ